MTEVPGSRLGPRLSVAPAAVAITAVSIALLATAGRMGLFEPTETRYAEIAREMVASGDWIVPRLDGITHLHKPPLTYWVTATGLMLAGVNEWGARLPVTIASILTLIFTALAARRRFAPLAPDASLAVWLLGSCVLFATLGRALASDPLLTAAVAAFWAFAPSPWAGLAIGLGALAKGPVVLVPTVLVVLVVSLLLRRRDVLALLGPAWGWGLALLLALPWYAVLAARTPGLATYWMQQQLVARVASVDHQRSGPPLYFVAVLLVGALPWTPALIAGVARAWPLRREPAHALALAWLLVPLALFSASGSKLPAYLLPALPAAALLTCCGLAPYSRRVAWSIALVLAAIAVGGALAAPGALAQLAGLPASTRVQLTPAAVATLACFAFATFAMLRGRVVHAAAAVTLAACTFIAALAPFESRLGSPRPMVQLLEELRVAGEPVIEVARFTAGVPFYLGETVPLLDVPRELQFDLPRTLARTYLSQDSLRALLRDEARVWLFGFEPASRAIAMGLALDYQPIATGKHGTLAIVRRRMAGD